MEKVYELSLDPEVISFAKKITSGNDLYHDIISETVIYIATLPEDKRKAINNLKSYFCKVIFFSWNSPSSPFYKKYRNDRSEFLYDLPYEECEEKEEKLFDSVKIKNRILILEKEIAKKRYPTEIRLLDLYLKLKSYRAVSKEVDIPVKSVHYQIKKIILQIKNEDTSNN